ncbi:maltose alpha-D-glucosyltransferase [Granulicella sibirica]|uniref:Maltokinase n=1 Tax=Granulicella sibirica TaxID=2479048 RepID=A0A4Q0T1Z5_9BACT|nr:maltose alpha-D-glucosyltransferase [Granulicella sibirica]RXH57207.1 Trehalose synthase [Granulicella sibirica]
MKKAGSATDPLWFKDAVIYELHVRAFMDSNGDGIGDFGGLLSRLDYLQDLGVTCIWLLPFFPSPLRDDGYDIANYVDVNPSYGTLNDFKLFLDAAHQRGMQVMIELVINHTSDVHPWFQAARLAPPGSPEREMYVWSDTAEKYPGVRIIFTDTEKSNWTWDETAQQFYWHRFFSHQPDLNFDNPRVMEEVLTAMRFWLDMGVDALRLDAIPYLVERDGTNCENVPDTHVKIKEIRAVIDAEYEGRTILAEANMWPADVRPYFGDGDECHMAFHFPLMPRIYMALRQEDRLPITDIMAQTPDIPANCQWGLFLRNHDELTLEMVTDDERDYMYLAYSADPRMRINVGIRRRLAPLVDNNRRRIELLNSLLLSFPGTPIMYYGDEIGMGDNIYLGDRNGVRTPMQWNSDRNAGFSTAVPARLYFPVIMDPIWGYQAINVEAQLSDQSSLLHWTRNMIALRKLFQVFGRGTLEFLHPENRKILAYIRDYDGGVARETVLCVANLSRFAQPVSLDLGRFAGMHPVEMLGYVPFPTITSGPYPLTIAPYSFLWLELQAGPVKIEEPVDQPLDAIDENEEAALDLLTKGWPALIAGHGLELLQKALPGYLPRQRWFGAKSRTIESVTVVDWAELRTPASHSEGHLLDVSMVSTPTKGTLGGALFFLRVCYQGSKHQDSAVNAGEWDLYQVPLAFTTGAEAEAIRTNSPGSILASFSTPVGPALLHDATTREDFRQGLLRLIETSGSEPLTTVGLAALDVAATLSAASTGHTATEALSSGEAEALLGHPEEATTGPATKGEPVHLRPHEVFPKTKASLEVDGSINGTHGSAFEKARGKGELGARTGSAEQSNTSILYGKSLILKLFRRLQPGENPDTEIGRFLTEVAHFPQIAPFLGEIILKRPNGEATTIGMLQGLVQNEGDGWEFTLEELGRYFEATATAALPAEVKAATLTEPAEMSHQAREHVGMYLGMAAQLGRRTAEMHLALATPTDDPAFAAEPFTAKDLERDAWRVDAQINHTLDALKRGMSGLMDLTADAAALVLSRRIDLFARAHAITGTSPELSGQRIRIHGDYHLGQVLRAKGDVVILDFEGEPARSLEERRAKQSPLRDVAGMLRSFSYAAAAGLEAYSQRHPDSGRGGRSLEPWARLWQNAISTEFLKAWQTSISANSALMPDAVQAQKLLEAFLLEKALYELLYELNNRPAWVRIPLAGILALSH